MIQLSSPIIGREEEQAVIQVLRSGHIAQGAYVQLFEKEFAQYLDIPYAVAVNNGTSALIAALTAIGVKPTDEIITTPFTFGATANSILAVGAIPHFVDIDPITFCIDPMEVKKSITKKTKAIIGVDLFGHPADWKALQYIARQYNLFLIEDAAQAHGAAIKKRKVGTFGDIATFSFYASKNITTGEGGMVVTKKKSLKEAVLLLRNHGMKKKYMYETLGYNFRLTDIQASIGLAQLKKLHDITVKRIYNAHYLSRLLYGILGITTPSIQDTYTHVFHQYTILVNKPYPLTRDQLLERLSDESIETGIHYPYPLHRFSIYRHPKNVRLPHAEKAAKSVLSLPIHSRLQKKDLEKIAKIIRMN